MNKVAAVITATNRFFYETAKWVIFAIVPIMLIEVVSRYAFDAPTVWGMELATLLFGPYFLLGGPYLLHMGGHVAVDLVKDSAGPRTVFAMELIALASALLFASLLTFYAAPQVLNSFMLRETSFSTWNPQIWPFKAILPLASFMLALQAIADGIQLFSRAPESDQDQKRRGAS
jgi:TRAP-type mannitol/chloroaromatic compound transport system permease small subunit